MRCSPLSAVLCRTRSSAPCNRSRSPKLPSYSFLVCVFAFLASFSWFIVQLNIIDLRVRWVFFRALAIYAFSRFWRIFLAWQLRSSSQISSCRTGLTLRAGRKSWQIVVWQNSPIAPSISRQPVRRVIGRVTAGNPKAFSREVVLASREENASEQK